MKRIDLNCDLGESFGNWTMGFDAEVMKSITSANIACGWHAGDPVVMNRTVRLAIENGVSVGAHPGYPDLMGFGRRTMLCSYDELKNYMIYQISALEGFCRLHGTKLDYVKPHGKLYLDALEREEQARAIADAILSYNPKLFYVAFAGSKGRLMRQVAREMGLRVVDEAFPDRAYDASGNLVARSEPGAVIHEPQEVSKRALLMAAEGKVIATDGSEVELNPGTLCVHGDTPTALALVTGIRESLRDGGVEVAPMAAGMQ